MARSCRSGLSMLGGTLPQAAVTASAAGNCQMEYLDRGISAINTGSGMLVSWRFLANDSTVPCSSCTGTTR